jgi:hypothetical protein
MHRAMERTASLTRHTRSTQSAGDGRNSWTDAQSRLARSDSWRGGASCWRAISRCGSAVVPLIF